MLIKGDEKFIKKLALNEGFYIGTFNELKKEYSKYDYNDSESIKKLINQWKNKSRAKSIIEDTFKKIKLLLQDYGSKKDETIINMLNDTQGILHDFDKIFDKNLIDKLKGFYNNNDYVLILNYFSEVNYNGDSIKSGLDMNFFNNETKNIYINNNFNFNSISENNPDEYEKFKTKIRARMDLSFPKLILDYGLKDKIIICSTLKDSEPIECYEILANITEAIEYISKSKMEINSYIEEIFKENYIYNNIFFHNVFKSCS